VRPGVTFRALYCLIEEAVFPSKDRRREMGDAWCAGLAIRSFVAYTFGDSLRRASGTINLAHGVAAVVAIVTVILVLRRQAADSRRGRGRGRRTATKPQACSSR